MNWASLREKFKLFDTAGLKPDTVLNMRLLIYAVMGGMVWGNITGGIAFTGYWKELGASDTFYGFLLALPMMTNAFQFLGSYILEKTRRRKQLFLITGMIQRVSWIPFALVPFIVPMSLPTIKIWSAAVLVFVSAAMGPFMNVAFNSICADVIPIRIRGRYFASRSRVSTVVGLIAGLLVGALLDRMPGMKGYCAVFLIAGVMGVFDIVCFFFMRLPEMEVPTQKAPMLKMMLEVLRDKKYMRIVLYCTIWMFSVQLCAPYFNVFMRGSMGLTNFQIILFTQIASNIMLILVVTKWGGALDRYGSKPVMAVGCFLIAVMPLLWTFAGKGDAIIVIMSNMLSGGTWCAYELGAQNLFMGQAEGENKSMYFAVFAMFTQLAGSALGSFSGGWLLDNVICRMEALNVTVGGWTMTRYNWLFLFAGSLRMLVLFTLLPGIKENGAASVGEFMTSGLTGVKNLTGAIKRRVRR